jgi:hypothetical protein
MDEAQLAAVEVGERELVVARALGEEAAEQLSAALVPAVAGVRMAAALVLHAAAAERGARGVGVALLLRGVRVAHPRAAASAASARIVLAGRRADTPASPAPYAVRSRNSRLVCAIPRGI